MRGRKPVAVVWRRSALPLYERDCRVLRDHDPVQTPPGPWRSAASPPLSGAADRTTRDPGSNTDPVPRPHGRRVDGLLLLLRPRSLRRPQLGDRAHRCPARPAAAAGRVGPRRPREIRASAGPTGRFDALPVIWCPADRWRSRVAASPRALMTTWSRPTSAPCRAEEQRAEPISDAGVSSKPGARRAASRALELCI